MADTLELREQSIDGVSVVEVIGELDVYHAFRLKELIQKSIANGTRGLVLDLTSTQYIDSSGVGTLIFANSICKKAQMPFRLSNPHGPVLRVIELTKLIGYLPIAGSSQEAIDQIIQPGA
ncbi:MAG: STAS domain-containing protein [Spirochaetota bacterium]